LSDDPLAIAAVVSEKLFLGDNDGNASFASLLSPSTLLLLAFEPLRFLAGKEDIAVNIDAMLECILHTSTTEQVPWKAIRLGCHFVPVSVQLVSVLCCVFPPLRLFPSVSVPTMAVVVSLVGCQSMAESRMFRIFDSWTLHSQTTQHGCVFPSKDEHPKQNGA
jgi:hypothetical protein